ncbi:hypothetical protein DLREEDagrD3_28670 [Denitratisoma sp. agr-D3]
MDALLQMPNCLKRQALAAVSADRVLDSLTAAKSVVLKLRLNGFDIISVLAGADGRTTVQVAYHPRIKQMLETGQAGYYYQTNTEQHGEFRAEANDGTIVQVVWVERKGH